MKAQLLSDSSSAFKSYLPSFPNQSGHISNALNKLYKYMLTPILVLVLTILIYIAMTIAMCIMGIALPFISTSLAIYYVYHNRKVEPK